MARKIKKALNLTYLKSAFVGKKIFNKLTMVSKNFPILVAGGSGIQEILKEK